MCDKKPQACFARPRAAPNSSAARAVCGGEFLVSKDVPQLLHGFFAIEF